MSYHTEVRKAAPQPVVSVRGPVSFPELSSKLGEFVSEAAAYLKKQGVEPAGPPFSRYHGLQGDKVDLEAGLPVATALPGEGKVKAGELPGGEVVATTHVGSYEGLPKAGAALDEWASKHDREAAGPNWEIYHVAPGHNADSASWKTEVVKPLK